VQSNIDTKGKTETLGPKIIALVDLFSGARI